MNTYHVTMCFSGALVMAIANAQAPDRPWAVEVKAAAVAGCRAGILGINVRRTALRVHGNWFVVARQTSEERPKVQII